MAEVDLYAHARTGVKSAEAAQRKVDAIDSHAPVDRGLDERGRRSGRRCAQYLAKLALDSREEEPAGGRRASPS